MGKADVYASDYLENAEAFADLVNGVLYHGEQVVKPEELSSQAKILLTKLADIKKNPGVSGEAFEKGEFSMCKVIQTFG